jgi:hypothetical protein
VILLVADSWQQFHPISPARLDVNEMGFSAQVDLKHMSQDDSGNPTVDVGIDLREYYPSVEWDILSVPARRNVKIYPCCAEPYPGENPFLSTAR